MVLGSKPTGYYCTAETAALFGKSNQFFDDCGDLGPKCDVRPTFALDSPLGDPDPKEECVNDGTTDVRLSYKISGGVGPYLVEISCSE